MTVLSIVHGGPLEDEPGLGALTLSGYIREVTARFGPREALVEHRPDGTVLRWSYAELWARAMEVARALVALGIGKGERVGVLMTNRAEFLSAVFGTALAGGVATTLSTFSTAHEMEHLLASSGCSVVLLERRVLRKDFAEMLLSIGAGDAARFPFLRHMAMLDSATALGPIERWEDFVARGAAIPETLVAARAASVSPADPGAIFFSSGSTNKPKGILSAHRGVAIQLWRMRRQQGLGEDARTWTANGFFWSGNFAMVVGGTLSAGGSIILQRTFDPEAAIGLMQAERATFLFAWPHQWAQLEGAAAWDGADLSSLVYVDKDSPMARHPTVASEWIEPRHAYGNTETFTLSTGYPAMTPRSIGGESHGPPFPGNTLKVVDPLSGVVVPVGVRGEVAIKGPTLMLGYLGVPLDETLDEEGYFRTGDGGYVDDAGRLFWEGRLNDIIKTGGANVSPVEIDAILQDCPGVKLTQTVGVPHETLGELVVACIVAHEGAVLDEAAVQAFAKAKLASYKVPRRVLFLAGEELALTGSAKVKTADLRKLVAGRL